LALSKSLLPAGRFAKLGLETSVVCRFDTGPTFIDTDGPTCHPPEWHHNQGVNLSSVIFIIFFFYICTMLEAIGIVLETVGVTTLDTHGRPHGLRPMGWPSPQDEALRGTTLLGASRKTPERYPENTTRSVRIRMII